jgi:hypothetical protein
MYRIHITFPATYHIPIVYRADANSEEDDQEITSYGEDGKILNGVYDGRLYSVDDIESSNDYYINPEGTKIAFTQRNATRVADYWISTLGGDSQARTTDYDYKAIKYANAGAANSIVKIFIRDVPEGITYPVSPPKEVVKWEEYLPAVNQWINSETLR